MHIALIFIAARDNFLDLIPFISSKMVYEKVDLDQDQRVVLWGVSRTRKTRKERDFRWRDVQRRKACRDIDSTSSQTK
jgi:hypothetical protein